MPSIFHCVSSNRKSCAEALGALAVCLALPLGGSAGTAEKHERKGPNRCEAIQVLSPQSKQHRRIRGFSATEILDLQFRVLLSQPMGGEHRLDLKVYTPDGQLYQTLTVPFQALDGARPGHARRGKRKLADYPQPIEEAEISMTRKDPKGHGWVLATLPVAGTSIVASSLYGRWTAEAFLDSALTSCGAAAPFVITE
jgi:hypothetical protein